MHGVELYKIAVRIHDKKCSPFTAVSRSCNKMYAPVIQIECGCIDFGV